MDVKNNTIKPKNDMLELVGLDNLPPEANLQLPDPTLLGHYKARANRHLYITRDIDDSLFEETQQLINWNLEDEKNGIPVEERQKVVVFVSSCGGDLLATYAFIDAIKASKMVVETVNLSYAYSAGAIIFINGHKGHRYATKHSNLLLHAGSSGQGGTYDQVLAQTENYKRLINQLHENILENTTIPKSTLTKKLKSDWYLSAEDQLKYGCCDAILEDFSQLFSK